MAALGKQVTVTTTATALTRDPDDNSIGSQSVITNRGTVSVFLGGPTVTASGGAVGYELPVGASVTLPHASGDVIYGIVAAATQRVDVLRAGVA